MSARKPARRSAETTTPHRPQGSHQPHPHSPALSASTHSSSPTTQKPRLSEAEKKRNHIDSEQKRRRTIRAQFARLATIVGMPGQGRSEGLVLTKAVAFLRETVEERRRLIREIERRGGVVPERERGWEDVGWREREGLPGEILAPDPGEEAPEGK